MVDSCGVRCQEASCLNDVEWILHHANANAVMRLNFVCIEAMRWSIGLTTCLLVKRDYFNQLFGSLYKRGRTKLQSNY